LNQKVFRARWIFPISRPPIQGGWVLTHGHAVLEIGKDEPIPSGVPVEDLGDAAILPGLVNAHTHLEFSDLAEPIGHAGIKLYEWISLVVASRKKRRRDPGKVISAGLAESERAGVRLVGEIATTPWAGFRSRHELELVVFAEILGLSPERADERLAAASAHFSKAAVVSGVAGAASPHAPYSTMLDTVRRSVQLASRNRSALAMHVAESAEERELIEHGGGPFAEKLRQMGVYHREYFSRGSGATLELLKILSDAPSSLIIHGNDLRTDELEFIQQQRSMTVVYCPRTHAFFNYPPHPADRLLRNRSPVALGTDSRASNPDLSIWNEVRWLLENRPDICWQNVLAMATIHGANALMRPDLGRIAPGTNSGLIAVAGEADRADQLIGGWISGGSPRLLTSHSERIEAAVS
jgi:aminodeoxyfutalosine deaminase